MTRPLKPQVIKLSSLDVHAPDGVKVMVRLSHPVERNRPGAIIADHSSLEAAQEHSNKLSAAGVRHSWMTWWSKEGRHVHKWPTMMHGKRRYFRVSVPYRTGVSDAVWKEEIRRALWNSALVNHCRPEDIRIAIDADRNRVETKADPAVEQLRDFFAGLAVPEGSMGADVYVSRDEIDKAAKALETIVASMQH